MVDASWTWCDGDWHSGNVALAGPNTHGLWLGSSVFDGARWFDGVAPDLDAHCARVNISAQVIGLAPTMAADEIVRLAWEGIARFDGRTALYIRPAYWAEDGDSSFVSPDPTSTRFCLNIFESALVPSPGYSMTLSPFRRPTLETMPTNAKAGCLYPNNARAVREARARGFNLALLCDMLGNVAETATANIFCVRDGVVYTPALNGTFLAGITRARIVTLLRDDGVVVVETRLSVADFARADEIFATGNFAKVSPITRFEDRALPHGPFTQRARALYFDWAMRAAPPAKDRR